MRDANTCKEKIPRGALEASQKGERNEVIYGSGKRPDRDDCLCRCMCVCACTCVPGTSCHFVGWKGADPVPTMTTHSISDARCRQFPSTVSPSASVAPLGLAWLSLSH